MPTGEVSQIPISRETGSMNNSELLRRMNEVERGLNQRTLAPSPDVAGFYEKTNKLKQALTGGQSHPLKICN